MRTRVGVLDYGRGNLHSIVKALEFIEADTTLAVDAQSVQDAHLLVLPGVGAFSEGMRGLHERGLDEAILSFAESGRGILGICLGCQMLLSNSEEFGVTKGLDLIAGNVVRIPLSIEPVPHVGWKQLQEVCLDHQRLPFKSVSGSTWVYFVHSYHCQPDDSSSVLATVKHGINDLTAVVGKDNIFGFQFHPEKSGTAGLAMLKDFIEHADY